MTTVPATAKKPSDRQAKKNEAAPDEAQDIAFEWGGYTYTIPAEAFDDVEILELLEDEKHLLVVRQILGSQWGEWKDRNRNASGRVPAEPLVEFLEALFAAVGQGNSPASPTS